MKQKPKGAPRDLKALLRYAGYKATPGRLELLAVLQKSKKPLSAEDITRGLGRTKIDKVTAYRTLAMLQKIGLVREVNLRHDHVDYELARDDHHHLICTKCGRIEDFGNCDLDALAKKALRQSKKFANITQHSLEFFGICKSCAQ